MRANIGWFFCRFGSMKYWSEPQPFAEDKITSGANQQII